MIGVFWVPIDIDIKDGFLVGIFIEKSEKQQYALIIVKLKMIALDYSWLI